MIAWFISLREIEVPSFFTKSKLNGESDEVFKREVLSGLLVEMTYFHCLRAFLSMIDSKMLVNL